MCVCAWTSANTSATVRTVAHADPRRARQLHVCCVFLSMPASAAEDGGLASFIAADDDLLVASYPCAPECSNACSRHQHVERVPICINCNSIASAAEKFGGGTDEQGGRRRRRGHVRQRKMPYSAATADTSMCALQGCRILLKRCGVRGVRDDSFFFRERLALAYDECMEHCIGTVYEAHRIMCVGQRERMSG